MDRDSRIKTIRYVAEIVMLLAIICVVTITVYSAILQGNNSCVSLKTGWTTADGQEADITQFASMEGESIYYYLDNVDYNQSILFSARNMFVNIYLDGVLVSEDSRDIPYFFGSSPGTRWHSISLQKSDKPVEIRIEGTNAFSNSEGYIGDIYYGYTASVFVKIVHSNLLKFLLSILWLIMGIACLCIYIFGRKGMALEKDFLYLSVGTLFCAAWCSSETNVWQIFVGNSELIHMISYFSLFVIPVPFGLLLVYKLEGKWKVFSAEYTLLAEALAIICFILNFSGIIEFHYTSFTVRIMLILILPFGTKLIYSYSLGDRIKRFAKVLYIAFTLLVAFIAIGIIYYVLGKYTVYASYIRWALFFLLFILYMYQLTGISDLFVKGLQADIKHEFALMDYLTKFYNRAGFAEHRERFDNPKSPIGIIQFDVNNLKAVNDNQGHEKGDELICLASSGIFQSFGNDSYCYRMGGDEFLVILTGEDPLGAYESGMKLLEEYCSYANSVPDRTFDVNIAHGFTMKKKEETLSAAMERADSLMYENKKMMKATRK